MSRGLLCEERTGSAVEDVEETASPAGDPLIFPDAAMRERPASARDITPRERTEFAERRNGTAGL
ncbi:hypothetical protein SUDANB176_05375 [Streptomyces sp. enrichment culture]